MFAENLSKKYIIISLNGQKESFFQELLTIGNFFSNSI